MVEYLKYRGMWETSIDLSLNEMTARLDVLSAVEGGSGLHVRPPVIRVTSDDIGQFLLRLLKVRPVF